MLARLLLGGIAWLVALFLLGALLQQAGSGPPRVTPDMDGIDRLSRAINEARRASSHPGRRRWTVTKSATFLREMVVTVAAEQPEESLEIAKQIVLPVRDRYAEILIYVHAVDQDDDPVVRRVDWTPRSGFVEMSFR